MGTTKKEERTEAERIAAKKRSLANLTPETRHPNFTPEQAREYGKRGAAKSIETKRRNRLITDSYSKFLSKRYNVKLNDTEKKMSGKRMIEEKVIPEVMARADSSSVSMLREMREGLEGNLLKVDGEVKTVEAPDYDPVNELRLSVLSFFSHAGKICPLYTKKIFITMEGGRAGGKTYQGVDMFIFFVCIRKAPGIAVAFRNTEKEAIDDIYPFILQRIVHYGLTDYFDITAKKMVYIQNQVEIRFMGMDSRRKETEGGLKGIPGLFTFFSDEAQYIRQEALDLIIPTFIRTRDDIEEESPEYLSKAIFCYNLEYDNDPVHMEFAKNKSREDQVLHIHIEYTDNYLAKKSVIQEAERMKNSDYESWLHIYKGEPRRKFKGSLWPKELLKNINSNISFDRSNYVDVIIACDPAETNNDFSNENGIQVEGKTHLGEGHHIKDLSGKMSPREFAETAIQAFYLYKASSIVVEENAGGDYIKSLILEIDPNVIVIGVKAKSGQSKVYRAAPVANLCEMGRIKHINGGSVLLDKQLTRMTRNGFVGPSGESPDRVDAYCWGFIYLFDLWKMETKELIFKRSMFDSFPKKEEVKKSYENVLYLGFTKKLYGALLFDVIETDGQIYFVLSDYYKGEKINIIKDITDVLMKIKTVVVYIPDDTTGSKVAIELHKKFVHINTIDSEYYISKPLNERVTQILPFISDGRIKIYDDVMEKTFNNSFGNLFINEMLSYSDESKQEFPLLNALCNMIFYEGQIE